MFGINLSCVFLFLNEVRICILCYIKRMLEDDWMWSEVNIFMYVFNGLIEVNYGDIVDWCY